VGVGLGLLAGRIQPHGPAPVSSAPPAPDSRAYEQRISAFQHELEAMRAELDGRDTARANEGVPVAVDAAGQTPASRPTATNLSPEAPHSRTAAIAKPSPGTSPHGSSPAETNHSTTRGRTSFLRPEPVAARTGRTQLQGGRTAQHSALAAQLAVAPPFAAARAATGPGISAAPRSVELAMATGGLLEAPAVSAPPPSRSVRRALDRQKAEAGAERRARTSQGDRLRGLRPGR
jgi:hypothetical protein